MSRFRIVNLLLLEQLSLYFLRLLPCTPFEEEEETDTRNRIDCHWAHPDMYLMGVYSFQSLLRPGGTGREKLIDAWFRD
jgi:hypothetical protein